MELRLQLQCEHALRFHEGYECDYGSMRSNGGTPNELAELERLRDRLRDQVQIHDTTPTGSTVVETTTSTDSTDGSNCDLTPQEIDGVDPERVLVAANLLGTGEVDVALSQGLVTADEVDLASIALRTGSLREWADRAVADR